MDGSGASCGEGCLRPAPLVSFFEPEVCPRFNSEVRSAVSVPMRTGSPQDSCPKANAGANAGARDDSVNAKWIGNLCIMMNLPQTVGA